MMIAADVGSVGSGAYRGFVVGQGLVCQFKSTIIAHVVQQCPVDPTLGQAVREHVPRIDPVHPPNNPLRESIAKRNQVQF